MIRCFLPLLALGLAASPCVAQTATPAGVVLEKAVNQPGANWQIYGPGQTVTPITDDGVPGGQAIRVTVSAKTPNSWDIGAVSPIQKPVAAGDAVLVAVYLRAPELAPGETVSIPFLGVNESAAPYASVANSDVSVGKEWKLYYASGQSPRAFAGSEIHATMHLGANKQVIDIGPVFVLDFGQNYDLAKLPKN